jgi:hypothetical protein
MTQWSVPEQETEERSPREAGTDGAVQARPALVVRAMTGWVVVDVPTARQTIFGRQDTDVRASKAGGRATVLREALHCVPGPSGASVVEVAPESLLADVEQDTRPTMRAATTRSAPAFRGRRGGSTRDSELVEMEIGMDELDTSGSGPGT